jgi:hypothetical protein
MTVCELINILEKLPQESDVYIAEQGQMHVPATQVMVADAEDTDDGMLSFRALGVSGGDVAVLVCEEYDK